MNNNKYSFWEIIQEFDKIEIPIIQRDYAQGRETDEIKTLRQKFIEEYVLEALINNTSIELDFVYGSVLKENDSEVKQKLFVPLDGQQRLTTLYLLHYYIALKEKRLSEVKNELLNFTYETRPSAHDFCKKLIAFDNVKDIENIKEEILDSVWFNYEWVNDPTVSGMLTMLDTFSNSTKINQFEKPILLDRLLDDNQKLISFYFTELEEFGLTENLYIRMNARGKVLNDFENFKSEFFKIIQYSPDLLEEVKNKIEYNWVENLWAYKSKETYLIDQPFLEYVTFITTMLYFKEAEFRSKLPYESNFLNFKLLNSIYQNEENLRFLIFSLDHTKEIIKYKDPFIWSGESIEDIINKVLNGKYDITEYFVMYALLRYSYQNMDSKNLLDYVRVVRNLIQNTPDNSRREWPRLIQSVENLITDKNVYQFLSTLDDLNIMQGFSVEQRKEEVYKSKLFLEYPDYKLDIFSIEDNDNFQGKIYNVLLSPFASDESDFVDLESKIYTTEKLEKLLDIYSAYEEISVNDFNGIWGDLIKTSLYNQTYYQRLIYDEDYHSHPAILFFVKKYSDKRGQLNLDEYLIELHKQFVESMLEKYDSFDEIRDVKEQLYLYYIIQNRIYKTEPIHFFKNSNFNFGWLAKEKGYKSHYTNGIEGDEYFESKNPIFQLYNQQFRYNLGINSDNTLDLEIVGGGKKKNPFQLIINWAKS